VNTLIFNGIRRDYHISDEELSWIGKLTESELTRPSWSGIGRGRADYMPSHLAGHFFHRKSFESGGIGRFIRVIARI
jgi:hypothetical protein